MSVITACQSSLKQDFTRAGRRVFLSLACFATTIFAAPRLQAQEKVTLHAVQKTTVTTPALTFQQQKNINDELRARGQRVAGKILDHAGNEYSGKLDELERQKNKYVRDYLPNKDYVVIVMDPLKFYALRGLGFSGPQTVNKMLRFKDPALNPDSKLENHVAELMEQRGYVSLTQDTLRTQYPNAVPMQNIDTEHGTQVDIGTVIVPVSDFAPYFHIRGLKGSEVTEFGNRHEGWHAVHCKQNPGVDTAAAEEAGNAPLNLRKLDMNYISYVCYVLENEIFADVAALGDMVHAGHGLDVVEAVAQFRIERGQKTIFSEPDETHMSAPALRFLSDTIGQIGIERFREMGIPERVKLYEKVTAQFSMTPERLALAYDIMDVQGGYRDDLLRHERDNPDLDKALVFARAFDPLPEIAEGSASDNSWITDIVRDVTAWDARQALIDKATESKKITPETMAQAYMELMTVYNERLYHGEDRATSVTALMRMIRLTRSYLDVMPIIDYVAVNAQKGIDILTVESCLKDSIDRDIKRPFPNHLPLRP